ncbi:MAG: tRNA guanosine(34) transglycosylase Tgt [Alistipes sp.]|nr:tRNA guanosine(34) transglycosylase Tgt [Alistipes sp.]
MKFTLQYKDPATRARAGEMVTDHGVIQTPIFMPVGTAAAMKGIFHRDVSNEAKAQIILANTYHLYLRPGMKILEEAGGVHRFSTWEKPMLTDSGGFQVFSLAACRKLKEEGCHFQSHIDGSRHLFTPESVIDTERTIGADIMMAFDECPPGDAPKDYAAKSLALTERWLDRCFNQYHKTSPKYGHYQSLFPIVQGCGYPDLRAKAAENVLQYNADGYAIGGLAVGEPTEVMYSMIEVVNAVLPEDKPRYLMGVGTPINILEGIARGVDMFDCVMPTRNGRNGQLFTSEGVINIRNKKWENDFSPIDPNGTTFVDHTYTKAYLHHLVVCGEMLAAQIASLHNIGFYLWLVGEARRHIIAGDFASWKSIMVEKLGRRL